MTFPCYGCGMILKGRTSIAAHSQWHPECTSEMRFWGRVDKSGGPDACWPWQGSVFKTTQRRFAYGRVEAAGPRAYAHRVAWMYTNGEIPADKILRHSCDNPRCCNPRHLSLGTHIDNMIDMRVRGRVSTSLKPEVVRAIRADLEADKEYGRHKRISEKYGIGAGVVCQIALGRKYTYIK